MIRSRLALAVLPLLVAGCADDSGGASTGGERACAAPMTVVARETVAPGETVTVTAPGLWTACVDGGVVGPDGSATYDGAHLRTDQTVTWRQGPDVVEPAVVEARPAGSARAEVTIPADARAGVAELAVGVAVPVEVTVAVP